MSVLAIARVYLYAIALAVIAFAVIRFVGDVRVDSGNLGCGPGYTFVYEGACRTLLRGRQFEVLTELILAGAVAGLARFGLRERTS